MDTAFGVYIAYMDHRDRAGVRVSFAATMPTALFLFAWLLVGNYYAKIGISEGVQVIQLISVVGVCVLGWRLWCDRSEQQE